MYEILLVDEIGEEGFLADACHLEDLGSPVDADEDGTNGEDGHGGEVYEVIEPGLADILLVDVVALFEHLH